MSSSTDAKPDAKTDVTRGDLADSTREITERVDSQTEAVRADLADRTETVREQVVDSTLTAKTALEDKTEAVRADLAERTEAVRVDLAERTDTIRQQVVEATHQAKRDVEDKTEATRHLLEEQSDKRRDTVDQKFRSYRRSFIALVIIMLVLNSALYWLYLNPRASRSLLTISDIRVIGPTDLCPGEFLVFSFDMIVEAEGVYELDMSVFRTSPPPTIAVFSERKTFVIGSPRAFTVTRHWQIPDAYVDEDTDESVQFVAGSYERDIAVSTTSRNTFPSTRILPFTIREDCE